MKHIVYKEGNPVLTEIIKINRTDLERDDESGNRSALPRRIKSAGGETRERRSNSEVLERKRKKLADRLKTAIQKSQTLWSEKEGIWISYQGSRGFLVKLFDPSNRVVSNEIMTQSQLLVSTIPGLLDTGWEVV
jgi:hypothetical protein